ncbi:MAG TPA: hypothetical protein VGE06_08070, partial [Flavisolibacter sp.]
NVTEIMSQIMINRGMVPQSKGVIHWSIGQVYRNENMQKGLLNGPYKNGALVPPSPWLDSNAPPAPTVSSKSVADSLILTWTHANTDDVFRWVVYTKYGNNWSYQILNRSDRTVTLPRSVTNGKQKADLQAWTVCAVDRMGNESEKTETNFIN